jgi:hypothetical protein
MDLRVFLQFIAGGAKWSGIDETSPDGIRDSPAPRQQARQTFGSGGDRSSGPSRGGPSWGKIEGTRTTH